MILIFSYNNTKLKEKQPRDKQVCLKFERIQIKNKFSNKFL